MSDPRGSRSESQQDPLDSTPTSSAHEVVHMAFADVLDPLLDQLNLSHWEGIPWSWLCAASAEAGVMASCVLGGPKIYNIPIVLANWRNPAQFPGATRLERIRWEALCHWSSWAHSVAQARGYAQIPGDWHIMSTYPGRQEVLPKRWVAAARDHRITWEEWRLAAKLIIDGRAPMDTSGMEIAIRRLRRGEDDPVVPVTLKRPRGRPPTVIKIDGLTPIQQRAFERVCAGVAPSTQKVYASVIRKIFQFEGPAERRMDYAQELGSTYLSVWRRFTVLCDGLDFEGPRTNRLRLAGPPKILNRVEETYERMHAQAEDD